MDQLLAWAADNAAHSYWLWGSLALILGALEIFTPTTWLVWPAAAAALMALIALLIPGLAFALEVGLFAVLALVLTVAFQRRWARAMRGAERGTGRAALLNRRDRQMIGQRFRLAEPAAPDGNVRVGDTIWRVRSAHEGQALPAGTLVEVVRVEGSTLAIKVAGS